KGRARGGAVQRPGRGAPTTAAVPGERRYRRQVSGTAGAHRHLLDDELERRGRPSGHGVPLQPEPPQRRHVAGASAGRARGLAVAVLRAVPDAPSDAPRERALHLSRARAAWVALSETRSTRAP